MSSDGRYRLVRTIASGGMAQVYEAVLVGARGFERRVAIKRVLPQHSHDPAMRRMFFDEAQLASRMHHGNIVQILDYGVVDECEFIAMEYVDGVDSNRAMRAGLAAGSPLPEGIALHIISQVADALHYAHTLRADDDRPAGIIHRDVAPDNVLLSWQGDVKLSDFGIALALGERDRRTRSGVIKGKRSFMAPEQALGHRITVAADVYALGVTLRALLASDTRPPGPVPVPDMCGASAAVVGLIDACTQHDPQARPAAEDIAERAGELVAATLGRDGRGALREWLEPLQPRLSRRSPFDEAFALALVPLGGRAFTVSRAADAAVAGGWRPIRGQRDLG
ncbi:MAG: serine/threonine protein kinase [Proteobacteria bacterium]|nr:serine/threonine protein kinase [Pseudomonadota bacterium]